ncbi:MAG: hypothetical protein JWN97_90 [Nocardioides sp.]|nr:hypothetical protein [Nocardioides sp.]
MPRKHTHHPEERSAYQGTSERIVIDTYDDAVGFFPTCYGTFLDGRLREALTAVHGPTPDDDPSAHDERLTDELVRAAIVVEVVEQVRNEWGEEWLVTLALNALTAQVRLIEEHGYRGAKCVPLDWIAETRGICDRLEAALVAEGLTDADRAEVLPAEYAIAASVL